MDFWIFKVKLDFWLLFLCSEKIISRNHSSCSACWHFKVRSFKVNSKIDMHEMKCRILLQPLTEEVWNMQLMTWVVLNLEQNRDLSCTQLTSVLAIGQLYHWSATAPGCATQLRDVRGLPLPVRSSKPVSCTFLNNFFYSISFPVLIRKFLNQSLSTIGFWFP